jgi:hypothetical protein
MWRWTVPAVDWPYELNDQLDWHWQHQLRARLEGLSDAEYFWEPAPDSWSIRPRGRSHAPIQAGSGAFTIDFAVPEPDPAPVTTIAWRLGHVIVGVLGARVASHFGGPPVDYDTFPYAGTAGEALDQLDAAYRRWSDAVAGLSNGELARPVGSSEGPFVDRSLAALVLHINREVIHHGAEIALLRDLYLRQSRTGPTEGDT